MRTIGTGILALGVAIGAVALPAQAQEGQPSRVRGTISSLDASTLSVDTREGTKVSIKLADDVAVKGVRAAKFSDIKVGDFVGVASVPRSGGGDGAVEVLIFPAAMRGSGEGSRSWDVQPNSTMTNATVANAVTDVEGGKLTLKYPQGEKTVSLPEGIPVVTLADASTADLKPGNKVFVSGTKGADGTVTTKSVVVGDKGVVPPM